jgi:DNA mismatch repair protein MutL
MIHILSDSVINKIAAGEVIERPASVVKELLENSFDSGADEIKIDIEDAGIKKIKITDNGSGMTREDSLLSFKRHTTSKLKDENDLFKIHTLGFRGEALASIAEISNLKITTKTRQDTKGTFIEVEAGKLIKETPVGCPNGTTIEVTDLFFNVPARKKYLKSPDVELSEITKILTKYALINKEISLKMFHNKREILNSGKTNSLLENITYVYGADITKNLIEVSYERVGLKIIGYLSKPNLTRSDKSDQSIYINNRYVKNDTITQAVYKAYKTLLFINRHPVFILSIAIDPSEIDVNVHPAKSVIRLKDEILMSAVIYDAIYEAIKKSNLITDITIDNNPSPKPLKQYPFANDKQSVLVLKESSSSPVSTNNTETKIMQTSEPVQNASFGPFQILGQVNKTYIIAQSPDGLAIIDQHAAQERVNYEILMEDLKDSSIRTQTLINPKILELDSVKYLAAMSNSTFLGKLGYRFEDFGKNTIKLSSVPEIFGKLKSILFMDILNELALQKKELLDKDIEETIIMFACKASVKAGDELTMPQITQLLKDLSKAQNPYSCPHGRPTIINLSIGELEKKFKRSGW